MKITLVCSHGGHLTELLYLMDAFKGQLPPLIYTLATSLRTSEEKEVANEMRRYY